MWAPGRAGAGPGLRGRGHRDRGRRLRDLGRAEPGRPAVLERRLRPPDGPGAGWTLARTAVALGAVGPPPAPPPEEFPRRRRGRLHSPRRDAAAVAHHYDVGNDFYALVLGPHAGLLLRRLGRRRTPGWTPPRRPSSTWSAASSAWRPACGCSTSAAGWGSLALHAARRYGVDVVGITLSAEQAGLARQRVAEAGLADRVTIRVQDYRDGRRRAVRRGELDRDGRARRPGRMPELRRARCTACCAPAAGCSTTPSPGRPGTRRGTTTPSSPATSSPTASCCRSAETIGGAGGGGFEILDVEALRRHYALTLRAWVDRLEKHWDAAVGAQQRGPGAGVAPLHGGVRARLRGREAGRRPGPGPAPAAASRRRCALRTGSDRSLAAGGKSLSPPAVTVVGPADPLPDLRPSDGP